MSFIYLLNTLNSHVKWNNMVSLQVQHGDSLALQKININTFNQFLFSFEIFSRSLREPQIFLAAIQ